VSQASVRVRAPTVQSMVLIPARRELQVLDLSSNSISTGGAINIAVALLQSHSQVQQVLLHDNCISGSTENLGRALAQLPSIRCIDLSHNSGLSVADCCSVFALMISSKAPIETLLLPANLFSEFPALFCRHRTPLAGLHTTPCW